MLSFGLGSKRLRLSDKANLYCLRLREKWGTVFHDENREKLYGGTKFQPTPACLICGLIR